MTANQLPHLVSDALAACSTYSGSPYVACIPFAVEPATIDHLLSRPDINGMIASIAHAPPSTTRIAKPVTAYSPLGKPEPEVWQGARALLFVGFTSSIPYGMLTSALRGGVKKVVSLRRGQWTLEPTWRLLAERHIRGGIIQRLLRLAILHLDRYGSQLPLARMAAKALNVNRSIADAVASIPRQQGFALPNGVAFYTGSLGAGGAERQMVNTILSLCARGIGPIRVACAGDAHGFYRPALDAAGIQVDAVHADASGVNEHLSALPVEVLRVASDLPREVVMETVALSVWLQRYSPRVLHCWQDHCNVVGGLAGLMSGVPTIVLSTRSVAPYNFGFFQLNQRPSYQAFAKRPEIRILNNSSTGADDYSHWLGIRRDQIEVIRNGVDLSKLAKPATDATKEFRASLGIPDGAPVIGAIFTIYKFKRPLLWVDAAALVAKARPDAHFVMVGDGPMRAETEERIAKHGLTARFHMPGRMEDVALALSAMQAFLLTSTHEGLPNVLLEAQMMGVPAVTVNVGGAAEAIDDGKTGLVVDEATPARLAQAVLAMLEPDQQEQSARLGPEFVRQRFGLERMVEETLSSYALEIPT
ncbi:MAG: glycosyltransferase [Alphaproteobacteria bacterium]|nr:glycosyltransferase [Alphaproteobacteria bacterium]